MVTGNAGALRSILRRVGVAQAHSALTDRELLSRFVAERDEDAFETVFRRHAPMVLGVCRRSLGDLHEAEDAFQATFIVLVRKAASVRWQASVGSWLYEVAQRVALEAKARGRRQRDRECVVAAQRSSDLLSEITGREFLAVLDEELLRLPEKFRGPIVLCCLEGLGGDEAARGLGCSLSTLRRRLSRGRELLRVRLARRGVMLSGATISAALLAQGAAPAAIHCDPSSALRAVYRPATGHPAPAAPGRAVALAEQAARGMLKTKLRSAAALLLTLAVLAAGAGLVARLAAARPPELTAADPPRSAVPASEPPKPADKNEAHADLLGDPLPPGAVARLGTSRLRGTRCRFLPDGKRLIRERAGGDLQIFEVPTGKPLAVIRAADVPGRTEIVGSTIAFTRDAKYLAAVCWHGRCGIWETATGRLVRWLESGGFFSILQCEFSPDGKLLSVGRAGPRQMADTSVGVYEVETGRTLFTTPGSNGVFAPDGRSLVTWNGYAYEPAHRIAVPGGETLTNLPVPGRPADFLAPTDGVWLITYSAESHAIGATSVSDATLGHSFQGPRAGQDRAVYRRHAPGRRELLAVGSLPPEVWCWDLETGKRLWQTKLAAPPGIPALSADGGTLVTPEESGRIRVWDAATGRERVSFDSGLVGHGTDVAVSPDGSIVATTSGGIFSSSVAFWDSSMGKLLSDLPGHSAAISAAAFAPDGATIYTTSKDCTLRSWDAGAGRERWRHKYDGLNSLAVSSDGSTLYAGQKDGSARDYAADTGRFLREHRLFQRSLSAMALVDDGKRLAALGRDGEAADGVVVRICEARSGALLHEFGGPGGAAEQLAVSPPAGLVATSHVGQHVVLWDRLGKKLWDQLGRGKRVSTLEWEKRQTPCRIGSLGLSPDGRWLAYSDQEEGVAVVDARTGREVSRARTGAYFQSPAVREDLRDALAFSPDGKVVAWSGVESTSDIFLIEARTGRVRRRLKGDSRPVQHLTFSPDGTRLLSAGPDGSALLWDVSGRPAGPDATPPTPERVADWWELLTDDNAARAYDLMSEMAGHPSATVELLRERLKPVKPPEPAQLDTLMERLDGERFADREAASRELVALGEVAEPRLREAARSSSSLEVKRRAADCLEQLGPAKLRPERAVEVAEMIGDRSARQLLAEWAGGMRGAALTEDAAGALTRLELRRSASSGGQK